MQLNEAYKSLPKRRRSKKEEPTEAERKKERKKRGAKEKQEKMNTSQRLCPMVFIIARFVDGAGSSTEAFAGGCGPRSGLWQLLFAGRRTTTLMRMFCQSHSGASPMEEVSGGQGGHHLILARIHLILELRYAQRYVENQVTRALK